MSDTWRKFIINEQQDQRKIFVLVGPPSVGKSSWIESQFGQQQPYIISRDEIVKDVAKQFGLTYDDMFVTTPDPKIARANEIINSLLYKRMKQADSSGKDIVVDMTNMTMRARKRALEAISGKEKQYKKIAVVFNFEGVEDLIVQLSNKRAKIASEMGDPKTVPEHAIRNMFRSYQQVSPQEGFDEVISIDNRSKLQSWISDNKQSNVSETRKGTIYNMNNINEFKLIVENFNDYIQEETEYDNASLEDGTPVCPACLQELLESQSTVIQEAKYHGKTVTLNKPMKGDVKKSKVFVKDPKTGNVKKVNFGDPNMKIKKNIPARRKSFRARHHCENPGPKTKARYWSCKAW